MQNFMLAAVSQRVYDIIMVLKTIGFILLGVCSLVMIIAIILQNKAEGSGSNVITGASETYYSQNKGSTREGKLKAITIICAVLVFIISIALIILLKQID